MKRGEGPSHSLTMTVSNLHLALRRVAVITVLLLCSTLCSIVRADATDTLTKQLADGGERERLAAALALIKLNSDSPKVLLPLAKAVLEVNEASADVRKIVAKGLGSVVTPNTNKTVRNLVIKNLQQAEGNDSDADVKAAASSALEQLGGGSAPGNNGGSSSTANAKAVYVNVGPMSSKTQASNNAQLMKLMNKTASGTLGKTAYSVTWPGGKDPTAAQLAAQQTAGFYVDGTLTTLTVKTSGNSATISCNISMLLADFPSKSMFGFPNGKASVQTGTSQKEIDEGSADCVAAVVENLITKQILPTIKSKTGVSP